MPDPIRVNDRITIPVSAIETRAVRASGPGGQNVNKLNTKIQMWIDLDQAGFTPEELARVREFLRSRLDAKGRLLVSSQATRDQARNAADAGERAAELLRAALHRPKRRIPTRPTRASKDRRVDEKRRAAEHRRDRSVDE